MTTWHNIPCPPTLPAVSQACPDGWLEVYIEHHAPRSMPGGGDPQEGETTFALSRIWGLDCDAVERINHMLVDLYGDEMLSEVPHKATVLARVIRKPQRTERMIMGDAEHEVIHESTIYTCDFRRITDYTVELRWGACATPVYSMDEHPSLTGQQPAPQPGRGDMWQQVIERYSANIHPSIIELFRQRSEQGKAQYGTPLQAGNGRSIFKDLADETLDRIVYAEQAATERPELAEVMLGIQESDIATLGGLIMIYGRVAPDGEVLP